MLLFKKEKKKDVLKGRTIRYLTKSNSVACTEVHLSNILNGKMPCGPALAKDITNCIGSNARIEDYFIKIEK
jgi:hypothetical protein